MQNLNLTLLQADLHWHDPASNRAMFTELVNAHAGNSDLIVLPETFSTGFTMASADNHEMLDGPTVNWLKSLAADTGTAICGSLIIRDAEQFYNRFICAMPDGQIHSYNKRHLFHMGGEDQNFAPGQERVIFTIKGWRICPMICYDLRFPVWSRNRRHDQGAYDLLLYVANWPAARKSAWETLLPARAVENLCYAAGVNRTGFDGMGVEYAGGSQVADYLGNLTVAGRAPTALAATLDGSKLERYREKFPAWKDADAFELPGIPE